ncbi:MAG TPA: nitrilase-related carbon-nitrogen hydrolase, partial [Puia sp.]|nr:nitrilase-related carbon-nitrogen hydrolase [Puia sp.]
WSITSPKLQEIQKAELPFIETADSARFKFGFAAIRKANDSLFSLSKKAVGNGAKIILWSEANALVFKKDERQLIERGQEFSKTNKVYLLMTIACIHPGKITASTKFLENEAVFIGPDGEILNVFHKNNPVPMAEASIPGDGKIPVIPTNYGQIATSICYDADFPVQMRQLGEKKADFLLLPSGDWHAISPFHSYMAAFRGVENGTAIVRQVSGGLSILTDYRGKLLTSQDYYKPGEKIWIADLKIKHINTIYTEIGDSFAWICVGFTFIMLIYSLMGIIRPSQVKLA